MPELERGPAGTPGIVLSGIRRPLVAAREFARAFRLQLSTGLIEEPNRADARPGSGEDPSAPGGLVVTLTTIPSRIGGILPTLNSLLDQTVAPEVIVLALPKRSRREGRRYEIPGQILNDPRIRVLEVERDWGPATKLIPTLRALADRPRVPVLVVDDDNVYPRTFVETFLRWGGELPEAALTLRGCTVPMSRRWCDCVEFGGYSLPRPYRTDIVEGCAGILVRPEFFDEAFFDYDAAPAEAFFVDDIWISGHLARRRVPAYVVPFDGAFAYVPVLDALRGARLDQAENRTGHNSDVMLEYFGVHWGWR